MTSESPASPVSDATWRRVAVLAVAVGAVLRIAWPLADPPPRTDWSNGIYTDPAVLVHAARNAVLFGHWIVDYNRDLWTFPLVNFLTWLLYLVTGPSRLPTVLLSGLASAATVGVLAWGLARSLGARAAAFGALLLAIGNFPVMFARIPLAENLTALLLVLAAVAALSRSARAQAAAGALAVFATLFGKYHAVGFLPGLVAFAFLRDRSLRSLGAMVAGGTAVFAAWLFGIFLPHRADIVTHVARQSTGLHGSFPLTTSLAEGVGEFYNSVRRAWLFYRIPVTGTLGGLFVMWALLHGPSRRARVADGTAIWALTFASLWIYYAILPYKAPRYYVLLVPMLCGGAAVALELLCGAQDFRLRPPGRWDEHVPLVLWIYSFFFAAIDATKHWASMTIEYLTLPPSRLSEDAYRQIAGFFAHLDTFRQGLFWAAALGIVTYVLVLWNPEVLRALRAPGTISARTLGRWARGLLVAELVYGLAQWGWFATHRTTFIEDVKSSFPAMIGKDAVILGPLAPLLTQDSAYRSYPYFGPPGERGLLEQYHVTHVVLCGAGDRKEFEQRYPGLLDSTRVVQIWPMHTLFASTLELRRLPPSWNGVPIHRYEPTIFERGADAASAGRWQEALDWYARYRAAGGRETPELVSLEAVCWFKLERYAESEKLLREAIGLRPLDPLNWRNLGVLYLRQGQREKALQALMRSYRLDPTNDDLHKMIEELRR
ncbi:MAG: tetratricopeptide repeat protein [bacterium]